MSNYFRAINEDFGNNTESKQDDMREGKMNIEDYYTQNEIDMMCMYYGQIPDNLTRNMQIMLVEKFENEIIKKVERIKSQIS